MGLQGDIGPMEAREAVDAHPRLWSEWAERAERAVRFVITNAKTNYNTEQIYLGRAQKYTVWVTL